MATTLSIRLRHGQLRYLSVPGAPVRTADGKVSTSVAVIVTTRNAGTPRPADPGRLCSTADRPAERAYSATGSPHALARRRRHSGTLALLFCDLDELQAGQRLPRARGGRRCAPRRRRPACRGRTSADTIGRFGGDEFLVLCEDLPDPDEGVHIAERLSAALQPRLTVAGTEPDRHRQHRHRVRSDPTCRSRPAAGERRSGHVPGKGARATAVTTRCSVRVGRIGSCPPAGRTGGSRSVVVVTTETRWSTSVRRYVASRTLGHSAMTSWETPGCNVCTSDQVVIGADRVRD